MNILIVGSGGREHALAWKAKQSPKVDRVFVAPGNAGTALEAAVENVAIAVNDIAALLDFAQKEAVGLTIVGPEVPLVSGIVDRFQEAGLKCSALQPKPRNWKAPSLLQGFHGRHRIPTANYQTFTDKDHAMAYIQGKGAPIVVKADGLAAGKGVIVAQTEAEAIAAVEDMLSGNIFGDAGHRVVIEEFLAGEEASFIVIADGNHALPWPPPRTIKPAITATKAPIRAAWAPIPRLRSSRPRSCASHARSHRADSERHDSRRAAYTGFLYAGLMIGHDGSVKVLEYNCASAILNATDHDAPEKRSGGTV